MRKISHIGLLVLLGFYYNSVPLAWLSYSTFAENIFAEHCINPTNVSCHGKCQVMALQNKAEKSSSRTHTVKLPQFHPLHHVGSQIVDISTPEKKIILQNPDSEIRSGIVRTPFHPPKVIA
jgi:hypothetical protein